MTEQEALRRAKELKALENSPAAIRNAKRKKLEESRKRNEEARAQRESKALAEKQKRDAEREAARQKSEAEQRVIALRSFLVVNPTATEEDFNRVYPAMRDAEMVEKTRKQREAMKRSYRL